MHELLKADAAEGSEVLGVQGQLNFLLLSLLFQVKQILLLGAHVAILADEALDHVPVLGMPTVFSILSSFVYRSQGLLVFGSLFAYVAFQGFLNLIWKLL